MTPDGMQLDKNQACSACGLCFKVDRPLGRAQHHAPCMSNPYQAQVISFLHVAMAEQQNCKAKWDTNLKYTQSNAECNGTPTSQNQQLSDAMTNAKPITKMRQGGWEGDRPQEGPRKEVEHEAIAGQAWVQHMAGAGALEGPEPGVLQALVGRGWHWLACSLT